jgi:hypothetical protein
MEHPSIAFPLAPSPRPARSDRTRSESEAEGYGARSGALGQRESWPQAMVGLASHPSVVG